MESTTFDVPDERRIDGILAIQQGTEKDFRFHCEMQIDAPVAGTVDQFERDYRIVGELEKDEASPVVARDLTYVDVVQGRREGDRAVQVGDAVGAVERFHAACRGG